MITAQKTFSVKCDWFLICDQMGATLNIRAPGDSEDPQMAIG